MIYLNTSVASGECNAHDKVPFVPNSFLSVYKTRHVIISIKFNMVQMLAQKEHISLYIVMWLLKTFFPFSIFMLHLIYFATSFRVPF